ncbi:MAG: NAD(+)/NADH kinase, partial [Spirochaetales bacterium]|nr:NAD(+)/NADH kinase [Spirochaetales bacterium]
MGHHLAGFSEEAKRPPVKRIGLIVNPAAGIGGRVGLKGSDGEDIRRKALELGAGPVTPERTRRALQRLSALSGSIELITCSGDMGETESLASGLTPMKVLPVAGEVTEAKDTVAAAEEMARRGIDLLLFTGGDGTARDIHDAALPPSLPVLGIPGGVKIHSAVYAASPEKAAALVKDFITSPGRVKIKQAEVMDIDEEALRRDTVSARLYGYLPVLYEKGYTQASKAGSSPGEEVYQDGIAAEVINSMEDEVVYLIAPGTTTKAVTDKLDLKGTLLGVDALLNRRLLAVDLNEEGILRLMNAHPRRRFAVVVTVIGKQGYLFGRGNQQLSPAVLRRVG